MSFCYGFPLKGKGANNRFRDWSRGVIKDPPVSLTPPDLILQSHWHSWIRFHCLIETMEFFYQVISRGVIDTTVSLTTRDLIPRYYWQRGIWSRGVIDTAESELFEWLSRFSRRIWSHMQNGFSPWIRALGGLFDEKKTGVRKSRDTVLLIKQGKT
jgi:hypothetical protein